MNLIEKYATNLTELMENVSNVEEMKELMTGKQAGFSSKINFELELDLLDKAANSDMISMIVNVLKTLPAEENPENIGWEDSACKFHFMTLDLYKGENPEDFKQKIISEFQTNSKYSQAMIDSGTRTFEVIKEALFLDEDSFKELLEKFEETANKEILETISILQAPAHAKTPSVKRDKAIE